MRRLLLFILLFSSTYTYAQNRKLWGGIEVGYGISFSDKGDAYDVSYDNDHKMLINTIRILLGYYVTPDLSLGTGVGFNSYTELEGLNTLPVFIDVRYRPFTNKRFLLNGDIGYNLFTSENNKDGNLLFDLSFGYKLLDKRICIVPAIGYNYCNYSINGTSKINQSRHSIFLKVGVVF
jgi:hypothetical protein